jgi:hypothetical protein
MHRGAFNRRLNQKNCRRARLSSQPDRAGLGRPAGESGRKLARANLVRLWVVRKDPAEARRGRYGRAVPVEAKLLLRYTGRWPPDGCKTACVDIAGYEPLRAGGAGPVRLKALDICAEGGRS